MFNKIIRCNRGYIFSQSYSGEELLEEDDNFTFRKLNENDIKQNEVFKEKGREKRYIKHLSKGHQCFGYLTANNDVTSYLWLSTNNKSPWDKGLQLKTDESSAYIWDCRTVEKFYRLGLYYRGLKKICKLLSNEKNIKRIFITCDSSNIASKKGILKAGFETFEEFLIIKVPFITIVYFKTSRKISVVWGNKDFDLANLYQKSRFYTENSRK